MLRLEQRLLLRLPPRVAAAAGTGAGVSAAAGFLAPVAMALVAIGWCALDSRRDEITWWPMRPCI